MAITRNALAINKRPYHYDEDEDISERSTQEDDQDDNINDHDEEDSAIDEDDHTILISSDDEEEEPMVPPTKKQKKDQAIDPTISVVDDDPERNYTAADTSPVSPSAITTAATPVGEENNHHQRSWVNDTPSTPTPINMSQPFLLNGDQTDEDEEDDVSDVVSDDSESSIATDVTEVLFPLEWYFNDMDQNVDEHVPTIMPDTLTSPHNENQPEQQYHNLNQDEVENDVEDDDELIELDAYSLNFDEGIPTTPVPEPATFDIITRGPIGSSYRPSRISIFTEQVQTLLQQDPTLTITKEEQVEEENRLVAGSASRSNGDNDNNVLKQLQSLFPHAIVDADDLLFIELYLRLGPIAKRLIRRQFNQVEKFLVESEEQ